MAIVIVAANVIVFAMATAITLASVIVLAIVVAIAVILRIAIPARYDHRLMIMGHGQAHAHDHYIGHVPLAWLRRDCDWHRGHDRDCSRDRNRDRTRYRHRTWIAIGTVVAIAIAIAIATAIATMFAIAAATAPMHTIRMVTSMAMIVPCWNRDPKDDRYRNHNREHDHAR